MWHCAPTSSDSTQSLWVMTKSPDGVPGSTFNSGYSNTMGAVPTFVTVSDSSLLLRPGCVSSNCSAVGEITMDCIGAALRPFSGTTSVPSAASYVDRDTLDSTCPNATGLKARCSVQLCPGASRASTMEKSQSPVVS